MALNNTYFESNGRDVTTPIPVDPPYVPPVVPTPPQPDPGSVPVVPVPSFSGNVNVKLYVNACGPEMINKDNFLSEIYSTTITIKDACSVVTPGIILDADVDISACNYMKMGNYYYYINVDKLPGGNRFRIDGKRDALTSFKNVILMLDCIIDKQQYENNMYINDGSYIVEEREAVQVVNFSSGFEDSGHFILIAAGG